MKWPRLNGTTFFCLWYLEYWAWYPDSPHEWWEDLFQKVMPLPENMASKSNDIRTFNQRRRLFPWSLLRTRPQGCLLKKCKEHRTTVQGAVQTAAGVSMVIMLEDQKLEVPTRVTVNIRPFLRSELPNDYAGPYFLAAECENLVVSAPDPVFFFRNMVKQASNDIHTKLKTTYPSRKGQSWSIFFRWYLE